MLIQRSQLEWEVNLPFMWIEAAARDDVAKESFAQAVVDRQSVKYANR